MKQKQNRHKHRISKPLNTLIREFRYLFGVQNLDMNIVICRDDKEEGGVRVAADVDIDMPYQRLYITFYPCFFHNKLYKQRQYLLHEFCHTFTRSLLQCADDLKAGRLVTPQQVRDASEEATSKTSLVIENIMLGFEGDTQKAYKKYIDKKK